MTTDADTATDADLWDRLLAGDRDARSCVDKDGREVPVRIMELPR